MQYISAACGTSRISYFYNMLTPATIIADAGEPYGWVATMQDGSVCGQAPGVSSDHLPADAVCALRYVPLRAGLPFLQVDLNLAAGERFVRFWSMLQPMPLGGMPLPQRRLYVLGFRSGAEQRLVYWYPEEQKVLLAVDSSRSPPYRPVDTFGLLPADVVVGAADGCISWGRNGVTAHLLVQPGGMLLRSSLVA